MSAAERTVLQELLQAVPPPNGQRRRKRGKPAPSTLTKKCTFTLPADLAERVRALCTAQDLKQRRVLETLLRSYVAQHVHVLDSA